MYMIEISEPKMADLSEHLEKSLKHMGKAMQCVEEWMEESKMGHRGGGYGSRYGERGGYGSRGYMGYKEDDEWEDDELAERRRRSRRTGRYM